MEFQNDSKVEFFLNQRNCAQLETEGLQETPAIQDFYQSSVKSRIELRSK